MKRFAKGSMVMVACSVLALGATLLSTGGVASASHGKAILVGGMDSLNNPEYAAPETQSGLQAAIDDVNAHGGVDSRPLKLDFCNTDYNANQEYSCVLKLIADKDVALLQPTILADQTGREYKAGQAAKIAFIGTDGLSPTELTSPVVFPASSGLPGWFYGAVAALVANGDTKIVAETDSNPASQYAAILVDQAITSAGLTPLATVTADPTTDPTLATAASELKASGADGIVLTSAPQTMPGIVQAIRATAYTGDISTITALFPPVIIAATGSAANGLLLDSQQAFATNTANSGVQKFLADMKKYEPNAAIDATSLSAWTSVMLYAKVAGPAHATTRAETLKAFQTLKTPVNVGTIAPYKVVGAKPPKGFPRIFNPTITTGYVEHGKILSNGEGFTDPFTELANLAKG